MFETIKHFFEKHIAFTGQNETNEENIKVASAALFMEMMHMEQSFEYEKLNLILTLLETIFSLTEEQADTLIKIAEHKRKQATDYFEFTHLICEAYTREQKIQLIECLWKIAFIDNKLEVDEEYLVDKVARLLFIPHADVLETRNRVREH